jgi:putative ABC transport system permease protein
VTARIALTREYRASDEAASKIRERLLQAMREIPGVTSVALAASTPFQGGLPINAFTLERDTLPPGAPQPGAFRVLVTPGYLQTLGLKLVEGRFYEDADLVPGRRAFVVDQSFARKFFPTALPSAASSALAAAPTSRKTGRRSSGSSRDVPHNGVEEKSGQPVHLSSHAGRTTGRIHAVRADDPARR